MDRLRREFWLHRPTKNLWAVEVSGHDESLLGCCGPFAQRIAQIVAIDDLSYGRGPTLDWLRAHREEFEGHGFGAEAGAARRAPASRAGVAADEALDALLAETRRLTRAEAGTVYVREAGRLRFAAAHNEALEVRHGWVEARRRLTHSSLSVDERSVASYVLFTHRPVNMADAYDIPVDLPYVFNPQWDRLNDYVTRSVLALPIRDVRGTIFGVLQLINARDEAGARVPFGEEAERVVAQLLVGWAQRLG